MTEKKKTKQVTVRTMAWENLKRNKGRTVAVIISMALSILMINATVSIVSCFDEEKYISSFASSDFSIADASVYNPGLLECIYDGVSFEDIERLKGLSGVTEAGAVFMSETYQDIDGTAWERMKAVYEEHNDWFVRIPEEKEYYDLAVYEEKRINSHLYGVDKIAFDDMELDTKAIDWETFNSGKYAIVSAPTEGTGNDADFAFYKVGEKISVELPDGNVKEYEVIAIGDVSYAMGPMHSHGLDMNITIPTEEYIKVIPESAGALQLMINVDKENLQEAEDYVEQYCGVINSKLAYKSRRIYLSEFKDVVNMFLVIGCALSVILTLIGIMNFINLTYTSIHERSQELKVLWSVGMTKKQITSMRSFEGVFRIGLTFALVLTVGQILNYVIVYAIAGGTIMFKYQYVVWPMIACIPVFVIVAALIPRTLVKKMN